MGNNKKIEIKGTKTQKILIGVQIFVIIFMLLCIVVAKHMLKIEDYIIYAIIFICLAIVICLMFIIISGEKDNDEDDKSKE